jgi:hypothetical protein
MSVFKRYRALGVDLHHRQLPGHQEVAVVPRETTPWPWPDPRRSPLCHGNGSPAIGPDCLADIPGRQLPGSDPNDLFVDEPIGIAGDVKMDCVYNKNIKNFVMKGKM